MTGNAADVLAHVRELESRDDDVAERLESVLGLLRRVDAIRGRAQGTRESLDAMPAEQRRLESLLEEASAREASARRELSEAQRRAEEAGRGRRPSEAAREAAEREVRRASVSLGDATTARERVEGLRATLVRDEVALRAEAEGLVVESAACGEEVAALPRVSDSGRSRPGRTLDEIDEWGARVHAALFVVRGGLEAERDRVVVEANGLAAAVLGEEVAGASVALVRRRLEKALGGA